MDKDTSTDAAELRRRADEILNIAEVDAELATEIDLQRLVHELLVHQIELELQNEELVKTRSEVEAGLERYTELYDFAPVSYFTLDREGNIRQLNLTGASLLGLERSRLVNSNFRLFISPENRLGFNSFIDAVFSNLTKETCELVLISEAGVRMNVHVDGAAVPKDVAECHIAVIDVTKRKLAEEKLRASESALNAAQRVAHIGSWVWHIQSNQLEWSDETYNIFGIDKDSLNANLSDVLDRAIHPEDRAIVDAANLSIIKKKQPVPLEYRIIRPDGAVRIVRTEAGELVLDAAGNPTVITGTVQDITQRKQTEEMLANAAARDHHIADVFQKTVMPAHIPIQPAGYEIATKYLPGSDEADVCGDFCDFFDLGNGRIGISIGDIEGKGLRAAIRVTVTKHMIRSYAYLYDLPSTVMTMVNDALCRDTSTENGNLTAFYAVLDTVTDTLTYCGAGHEPPLVRSTDGKIELLNTGGPIFCGLGKQVYQEGVRNFQAGDVFIAVTDGITEAGIGRSSEQYGTEGIVRCLSANPGENAKRISAALLKDAISYANGNLHDDATLVVIRKI